MAIEVTWVPTNIHVYQAIYTEHHDALAPFGTRTEVATHDDGYEHVMTEWGFRGADAPIIKSVRTGQRKAPEFSYFIANVKHVSDD